MMEKNGSNQPATIDEPPLPKDPAPVQVVHAMEEEHRFELNDAALEAMLLRPDVADKKVVVISVAGAFRKGKSFLLNFFLRFLQYQQRQTNNNASSSAPVEDWLGADNEPLDGFSWRGGSERETSGILMWRDPFFVTTPNGEEVAVFLLDTQGAFDSQSTVKDCATIFALSTMVSSVQIYNLSQNIQEDDLQHLQLFTEYGRLALKEDSDVKPFQALMFLVRDWSFPYEAEYGFIGGGRILERRLQVNDKQHGELQQLRTHIRSCFESMQCFLLPHPGLKVATHPDFKGQLSDIEGEFKQQLRSLVPRLLSAQNLVLKEINGQKVTGRELLVYFRAYIDIFQGEVLPEPKSMLAATAEANNLAAVASAKAHYCRSMEEICGGDTPFMASDVLAEEHERCRGEALTVFRDARKMGGSDYSHGFQEKLDIEIEEAYDNFVKVNNGKNLFKSMRTPAVLFTILVIDYVLQEIFQLVALDAFATTCSTLLGIILLTLGVWAYSRYSGTFRDAGIMIDDLCEWVWQNVLSPLTKEGVKKAVDIHLRINSTATAVSADSVSVRKRSTRPVSTSDSFRSTGRRSYIKKEE